MNLRKSLSTIMFAIMFLGVAAYGRQVIAQASATTNQSEKQEDETNLDTQLYLLVATNQDVDDSKMPAALDPVVKQLRGWLPFKNYRLATVLINRVKNEGRLSLKWVGGPLVPTGAVSATTPSFNEFNIRGVKLVRNAANQSIVRFEGFAFGMRVPVVTASPGSASGSNASIINYESTGLNTDISMREGEPVVVGTLTVGTTGDTIILVVSAKSTNK